MAALTFASRLAALRCGELRAVAVGAVERLGDLDAVELLGERGAHVADRLLARSERSARDEAEQAGDDDHHGHDEQGGERELPVDPHHRDERGREPDQRAEDAAEPLRQERVDLCDVVDEAAHEVAGFDGLEEADVELLDLGDDVVPGTEERSLACRAEREDLLAG